MAGALAAGVGTAVELFADVGTVAGAADIALDAWKAIKAARAAGRAREAEAILAALAEYERAKQTADKVASAEAIRRAMKADSEAAAANRAISGEPKVATESSGAFSREGEGLPVAKGEKVPDGSATDPKAIKPDDSEPGVPKAEPCPPCSTRPLTNRGTTRIGPGYKRDAYIHGPADGTERWSSLPEGRTSAEQAAGHYEKHVVMKGEFPEFKSQKGYVEAANKFVSDPPPTAEVFIRQSGEAMIYDPASNTFAVRTADGVPVTFMRPGGSPEAGMQYWTDELNRSGGIRTGR